MNNHFDVIVVGGSQAGLAMGYHLARQGRRFVILDADARTGDVWRSRWDSLTLFTPARYNGLPGLAFPAEPEHLPHKDDVASYLEHYAARFSLPVNHGERAISLTRRTGNGGFEIRTADRVYTAQHVVIATGPFQKPRIPGIASALSAEIVQMHSSEYRNEHQLADGDVLVVGAGNSGVQIASEVAATRPTTLAVSKALPAVPQHFLRRSIFWWLRKAGFMSVTIGSRLGQRISQRELLIGQSAAAAASAHGFRLAGRAAQADGNTIRTAEGAEIRPRTIIWATGYTQDFSWIEVPAFGESGRPVHTRGVSPVRGLYFLGLPWLHTRASGLLGGVGADAAYLAGVIGQM